MNTEFQLYKKAKQNRNLTLLCMCLINIIHGFYGFYIVFVSIQDVSILNYYGSILNLIPLYFWCHFDAQLRNFRISSVRVWIVLFAIIGVPLYFWRTRNRRRFFLNIGGLWLFLLPIFLSFAAFFLASIIHQWFFFSPLFSPLR